jgi:hypothetical protein
VSFIESSAERHPLGRLRMTVFRPLSGTLRMSGAVHLVFRRMTVSECGGAARRKELDLPSQ